MERACRYRRRQVPVLSAVQFQISKWIYASSGFCLLYPQVDILAILKRLQRAWVIESKDCFRPNHIVCRLHVVEKQRVWIDRRRC